MYTYTYVYMYTYICMYVCMYVSSLSLFTFMHWRKKWQPTPVCMYIYGERERLKMDLFCKTED